MRPSRIKSFSSHETAAIYNAFSGFTTVRFHPDRLLSSLINNARSAIIPVRFYGTTVRSIVYITHIRI